MSNFPIQVQKQQRQFTTSTMHLAQVLLTNMHCSGGSRSFAKRTGAWKVRNVAAGHRKLATTNWEDHQTWSSYKYMKWSEVAQLCPSGLPFPSPGDLPNPGIEPWSPTLQADALTSEPPAKSYKYMRSCQITQHQSSYSYSAFEANWKDEKTQWVPHELTTNQKISLFWSVAFLFYATTVNHFSIR